MYKNDRRIVITLDAGGTNFVFSAMRGYDFIVDPITYPSNSHDLKLCLDTMVKGFEEVIAQLDEKPVAISFAFPGPADYRAGIIGGYLPNFPSFRDGVALGPFLSRKFGLPVYINNDGDLFAFGEATGGMLPEVNRKIRELGGKKPLYPFGYGLSYTTFDYGKGRLSRKSINVGENVRITVPVTNTGSRRGTEVVQVYVRRLDDVAGPDRSLRAFARQEILPGRTADIVLDLDAEAFASYDPESGHMGIVPGKYEISYGPSSAPEALKALSLTVK